MGGWKAGPGTDEEVFAAAEYREHARPGGYTRSVITNQELIGVGCKVYPSGQKRYVLTYLSGG